jgi:hypothetical protein
VDPIPTSLSISDRDLGKALLIDISGTKTPSEYVILKKARNSLMISAQSSPSGWLMTFFVTGLESSLYCKYLEAVPYDFFFSFSIA